MYGTRFLCSILLATTCLASAAHAQSDSFSLNFSKIEYNYDAIRTGGLPFELELVHGEEGSVTLRPVGSHNLTLKRGLFYPADPLPQSWLGFEMAEKRGQIAGVLNIGIDQSTDQSGTGPGAEPHIRILDGGNGAVQTGSTSVLMGDGSVRFIRNSPDVRLWGAPAALFNDPGPGEPLEARLPTPAPGQTIELQLKVMDDQGASMMLPVRISRPR
jgi:hypothetical protein